jgi:hypothetical protein
MKKTLRANITCYNPTATFYTIIGDFKQTIQLSTDDLSHINYHPDELPKTKYLDINTRLIPNNINQEIFKSQTMQWWVDNINNGNIIYNPICKGTYWTYINKYGVYIYISSEITSVLFSQEMESLENDKDLRRTVITFKNNTIMKMTCIYSY